MNVSDTVKGIIAEHRRRNSGEPLADTDGLIKDLGFDSLDLVTITIRVENVLEISIDDLKVDECVTVGDFVQLVVDVMGK